MPAARHRLAVALHRVRGHRHDPDRTVGPAGADLAGCLEPVELGHLDVHEHDVILGSLEGCDGLEPVGRHVGRVAHPLEQPKRELLVHGVVLGQQDSERMADAELPIDSEPRLRPRCGLNWDSTEH